MNNKYNKIQVLKPWGKEYLAYQNKEVALWVLHLNEKQSTSMHCHPTKTTGLVCVAGDITVSFLADCKPMQPLSKVMIRRGLFHKTEAHIHSIIFEIESPNNKKDLLRLKDSYGRESKSYEGKNSEVKRTKDCLWIKEPKPGRSKTYTFFGKELVVENLKSLKQLKNKKDDDLIILLSGGFYKRVDKRKLVSTKAGDVGYFKIMKQVVKEMDGVCKNTIIMTIK